MNHNQFNTKVRKILDSVIGPGEVIDIPEVTEAIVDAIRDDADVIAFLIDRQLPRLVRTCVERSVASQLKLRVPDPPRATPVMSQEERIVRVGSTVGLIQAMKKLLEVEGRQQNFWRQIASGPGPRQLVKDVWDDASLTTLWSQISAVQEFRLPRPTTSPVPRS
jgi:hypothetical protein